MNRMRGATFSELRRYRATFGTLAVAASIAVWPGLLFPVARAYVEFSFHHPLSSPLAYHYPPFVVAALILWMVPMLLIALALTVRQALGQYRLHRRTRGRLVEPAPELLAIAGRAGIADRLFVVNDAKPLAFCAGFFRPAVYVSDHLLAMLDVEEIEAVLRHEASHLRRRDPLRLFLLRLLHVLLAPLPAIETLCDRVRIGIELAADRAALASVPIPALAGAVVKVARASSSEAWLTVAGLSAGEARIDALLGRPINLSVRRRDLLITAFVLLAIAGVLGHLASLKLCPICPTL